MDFKKYNSIENHYSQKYLFKVLSQYPELGDIKYMVREKIDGANIQLVFTPNEPMKVGRRSAYLKEDEAFFDIWNTLAKYNADLLEFSGFSAMSGKSLRLYGEIFGKGIQDRVYYGDEKYIRFFDAYVDDVLLSQKEFEALFEDMKCEHLLAPKITVANNLNEALNVDVNFNSKLSTKEDNATEGVVITPYDRTVFLFSGDERLIIKKKNESFAETERKAKVPKLEFNADHLAILTNFRGYINKNRVLSVFSKHGPISSIKDMGKYIKLVQEDAKEEFLKENELPPLDDKAQKIIFNVGTDIALLLKSFL